MNHDVSEGGESMATWALWKPGFRGTVKQLTHCGRCGGALPFKRRDEPRHYGDVFKPTFHCLCDDCYDALPA